MLTAFKATMIAILLAVVLLETFLVSDYLIYQQNIESPSCCGYVAPEWYKRPVTHLLVDWTEPQWKPNAVHSQMWLVSEGLVQGNVQFWTVWDKSDM
ncbi:hypothetical protein [Vibrio sp. Hal054]|uniref:hypothetical protein n=1 Tax=Vibrio sp. Hal054 TaxID=3035158 RepID=UPI00301E3378